MPNPCGCRDEHLNSQDDPAGLHSSELFILAGDLMRIVRAMFMFMCQPFLIFGRENLFLNLQNKQTKRTIEGLPEGDNEPEGCACPAGSRRFCPMAAL